jgi:hypothetical protein
MADGTRMQQRRATEAVWSTSGYVLASGELGVTTDTGIIKIGNGTSPWSELDIAFDSQYLPILGKAADSELLDGIDSAGYWKTADATTTPSADKLLKRLGDGRAQAAAATSGNDLVNFTQWDGSITTLNGSIAQSIVDGRKRLVTHSFSDAVTTVALVASDVGGMVSIANSSLTQQRLVTIPTNASVPIAVGSWIDILSTNEGNLKLSPAAGVSLNGKPHVYGHFSVVRIIKTATDSWTATSNGVRRGRTPKIRVIRTGTTGYATAADNAVPFDSVDSAETFNPDNEWFTIPSPNLSTARRVGVVYAGEYLITVNWNGTVSSQGWCRICKMTANNVIGTRMASAPTFFVGSVSARLRLAAGETIGAVNYNAVAGSDLADGSSGNPHDMYITLLGY